MDAETLIRRKDYIMRWLPLLDKHIGRYCKPAGKRVLAVGCGWGTEVLWALLQDAAFVLGVDPRSDGRGIVHAALKDIKRDNYSTRFEIEKGYAEELTEYEPFDLIISVNVFEHVIDIARNLRVLKALSAKKSRTVVFTAPLYFSSCGSHLHLTPWAHLTETEETLQKQASSWLYKEYRDGLNGMTVCDFLTGVRDSGMILLNMHILPDRNIGKFPEYQPRIPATLKPMDLCLEGVCVELAFPDCL